MIGLDELEEKKMYDLALKIATEAHEGQTRKFGEDKGKPYIIHPIRVASNLKGKAKQAGVTHDTIEDTNLTKAKLIEKGIHEDVAEAVDILSKKKGDNYFSFIMRIVQGSGTDDGLPNTIPFQIALIVKIEDIKDNSKDLKEGSMKDKYRLALYILENHLSDLYNMGLIEGDWVKGDR